jgi:branched-chain amino acid transport system substrate-binding protein
VRNHSPNRRLLSTFLALLALAGGCGKEGGQLKIGEYGSLTGDKATFGTSTHHGVEMALDEANAAGGVGGLPLTVIVEDDQGRPEEAATAVNKLIVQDQVLAVLGEVASSNSLAAAPICQEAKVPMITPSSTNPAVTEVGDYIFRICFIDPFQGTVMARFAHESLAYTRVGILRDVKSDYSVGLAGFFTQEFLRLGGTITGDESYQQGDVDFKAPLTALMGGKPEALYVPGYYTEVGLIARQARELGYTGPLLGGDGWDSPKLTEIAGGALDGSFLSNHYSVEDPNPVVQNFVGSYRMRYGEAPDAMAALGYDAMRLLVSCLKQLNEEDGAALAALSGGDTAAKAAARARLRALIAGTREFPGVTGLISLNAARNAEKPAVVLEVQGGQLRFRERIGS